MRRVFCLAALLVPAITAQAGEWSGYVAGEFLGFVEKPEHEVAGQQRPVSATATMVVDRCKLPIQQPARTLDDRLRPRLALQSHLQTPSPPRYPVEPAEGRPRGCIETPVGVRDDRKRLAADIGSDSA